MTKRNQPLLEQQEKKNLQIKRDTKAKIKRETVVREGRKKNRIR